VTAVSTN